MSDDSQPDTEHSEWADAEVWENIERAGKLIEEGREDEIPLWVLDDYRATQSRVNDHVRHPGIGFMKSISPEPSQVSAARSMAQNLAKRASQSIHEPEELLAKHAAKLQRVEGPDFEAITESAVQAQTERVEREEQAAARADLTNEWLSDLFYILAQVERSNASTVQVLEEIQKARKAADHAGTRQFWINIAIVVVMGIAAIFGPVILRLLGLA